MTELDFEWDDQKAAYNQRKHRVRFEEAASVFDDPRAAVRYDDTHSTSEDRWKVIGTSTRGRLLAVIYTVRGSTIRIISARNCDARETKTSSEAQG